MASKNKKFRLVPVGTEVFLDKVSNTELQQELQDKIDFYCSYECYFFDCGLSCPDDCPVLDLHHTLKKLQEKEEQEIIKQLMEHS